MELYLLRHGAAEDHSFTGDDRARRLTADGASALRSDLKRATARGVQPALILSSPYQRAVETAEIAAEVLGVEGPVLQSRALEPDSSPSDLWNEVRVHEVLALLVVSHEPLLSSTLAWLLGETEEVQPFAAGSLAKVTIVHPGAVPRAVIGWMPGLLD
jgi:phosphohistidine phosphatase